MPATAERIALVSEEFRYVIHEDATIKTAYPLAREDTVPSFFDAEADANTIGQAQFNLLKGDRQFWVVTVAGDVSLDFSAGTPTVTFKKNRFGLDGGRDFAVVGLIRQGSAEGTETTLEPWG